MSLTKQALGGVKWTSISAAISALVQLLQVIILARFLDKKDFGLMALALFVIGISQIFIDMGISNSIIHKQKINKIQLSTLFWLNILIGFIIFLLLCITAPVVAIFYHEADLVPVLKLIGTTFIIIPWGQQFESLLRKDLKFKALSIRDIIGKVIGLLVAIVLAYLHFGVYSLVFANIATAVSSTLLLIIYGLKDYKPKLVFSIKSLKGKGFFSFGLFQIGEQIINYFNSQFDTILIGKLLGMEALGVYNIAKTLALRPYMIINPIITKVAFPVFAKLQDNIVKLKKVYLKIIQLLTLSNAPIYAILIILAKPVIFLLFGKQWESAIPLLQILSVSALSNSINNPVGSLQLALGRADLGFYWNLGMFIFMPFTIYIGSHWGVIGVAYSLTLFKIVIQIPVWYFFIRPLCKASFIEYFSSYINPLAIVMVSSGITYFVSRQINNVYYSLIVGCMVFIAVYFALFFVFFKETKKYFVERIKSSL